MVNKELLAGKSILYAKDLVLLFYDLLQSKLDNFVEFCSTHHIQSSKPNCISGVPDQLFTFPEEYGHINCGTYLLLAELDHLKQQIDIEREA